MIVDYPAGNYIRRVVAEYANDRRNSLTKYTIRYEVAEKEFYTVTYAPRTNTVGEDHANGEITYRDHGVVTYVNVDTGDAVTVNLDANLPGMTLLRDSAGAVYLHHYDQDEILEAVYTNGKVTYKSGSGKNANAWYEWDLVTSRVTRIRTNGLRAPKSFKSPRVM